MKKKHYRYSQAPFRERFACVARQFTYQEVSDITYYLMNQGFIRNAYRNKVRHYIRVINREETRDEQEEASNSQDLQSSS
jgi:hypothetical protein